MKYTPTILSAVLAANQVTAFPSVDGFKFSVVTGKFATDAKGTTIPQGSYVSNNCGRF